MALTKLVNHGKRAIHKENNGARDPSNNQISDENVPALGNVVRTIDSVHRNSNVGGDCCHRRCKLSVSLLTGFET